MSAKLFVCLVLLFLSMNAISYDCDVLNCQSCSIPNVCGRCQKNYLLLKMDQVQEFSCIPISCPQNCDTCYQNNVCQVCNQGFSITSTGKCSIQKALNSTLPPKCLWASKSDSCNLCSYGYTAQEGKCILQIPNLDGDIKCLVKQSSRFCQICQSGYIVNFNGRCISQRKGRFLVTSNYTNSTGNYTNCTISNCQTCTNSTYCQQCASKYANDLAGMCIACDITGCAVCSAVDVCDSCQTGFQYTVSKICIPCSVDNCDSCSGPNICQKCTKPSQSPSPTGSNCFACDKNQTNMAGCLSCSGTNLCGLCSNGYQLLIADGATGGVCIKCNIQNCKSCKLDGTSVVCNKCMIGHSVNAGKCVSCQFPCATCTTSSSSHNCDTCITPFFISKALSNGTCVVNTIPNCITFDASNSSLCTGCDTGLLLNLTSNTCYSICADYCKICTSQTVCTTCVEGYTLAANSTCIQCKIKGCSVCSADGSSCTTCLKGFYPLGGQCKICLGFCSACSSNATCTQLTITINQVLIIIDGIAVLAKCQDNCITCSNKNPQVCLQCQSGNYLSKGRCKQCSGNCMACDQTDPSKCLSCYPNSFLQTTTCATCDAKCLTCAGVDTPTKCTSCPPGSYLSGTDCISGCPQNCYSCSDATTCVQCMSGYTTFTQDSQLICAPCTTSCRSCAEGQPASCISCGVGFYLLGTTCKQCADNCASCSSAGCNACVEGFFLTSEQTCSQECSLPCSTCSSTDPTKCTGCIAGYTYSDTTNSCTQKSACNGACAVCPIGRSIFSGVCKSCTATNCRSCDPQNTATCYSCKPAFYLTTSGTCSSCDTSCRTCASATGCLKCAKGYTRKQSLPAKREGYQCLPCVSPCATCLNTPTYCTSCVSGHKFFGWKCGQKFYFGFKLKLMTTLKIFNRNYFSLIISLTKAIGRTNSNSVTVLGIKEGSVDLDGGVAPSGESGSTDAGSQLGALGALLNSGSLAGMGVGSASVTVEGGAATATTGNNNTSSNTVGIILGIVIPIVVLLIVGLIVVICVKKKQVKQDGNAGEKDGFESADHIVNHAQDISEEY